jgi:hypothetical protein
VVPVSAPRRRSAGVTLVELLVALVLGGVVLGTVGRVLHDNQRFYRSESQILDVEDGLRAVVQLLPAELRELDARSGDLVAMGRDSISVRAMRAFGMTCTTPDPASGTVVLSDSLTFGWRAIDPSRDRALIFRDGDPDTADDDRWLDFAISGTSPGATCDGGAPGTSVRLAGPTADLDSVAAGSPLRTSERSGPSWCGRAASCSMAGSCSVQTLPPHTPSTTALTAMSATGICCVSRTSAAP